MSAFDIWTYGFAFLAGVALAPTFHKWVGKFCKAIGLILPAHFD
jgi:hypothetical protein